MCSCVHGKADLQWSQDDLHATGAFWHHLFSTLLCNTQQSKNYQHCICAQQLSDFSHKPSESCYFKCRRLSCLQWVNHQRQVTESVSEDYLGTWEDNCPALFAVRKNLLHFTNRHCIFKADFYIVSNINLLLLYLSFLSFLNIKIKGVKHAAFIIDPSSKSMWKLYYRQETQLLCVPTHKHFPPLCAYLSMWAHAHTSSPWRAVTS